MKAIMSVEATSQPVTIRHLLRASLVPMCKALVLASVVAATMQAQSLSNANTARVAVGNNHMLAVLANGTVMAWGNNGNGALGLGNNQSQVTPQLIPVGSLSGVVAVAAGDQYSLALLGDGTVKAWGWGGLGQLGTGYASTELSPQPIPAASLSGVVAIAAGSGHCLALLGDGTVKAWGNNASGQLGIGNTNNQYMPQPISSTSLSNVIAIAAGGSHSLALLGNGQVKAWGNNASGQLGIGNTTTKLTPQEMTGGPNTSIGPIVAIAAGGSHTLALRGDGAVFAGGNNASGQLGLGNTINQLYLQGRPTSSLGPVAAIAAGDTHSVMLRYTGNCQAWGSNQSGQLGTTSGVNSSTPQTVNTLYQVDAIVAGGTQTIAVRTSGELVAWGNSTLPQSIQGLSLASTAPTQPPSVLSQAVSSDWSHTLALTATGNVLAWGENFVGGLGIGSTTSASTPQAIPRANLNSVTAVAAGYRFSLALLGNGSVMSWGENQEGQLGIGNNTAQNSPQLIPSSSLSGVIAISAGHSHGLALLGDGTVKAWGRNFRGQLGIGNYIAQNSPQLIPNLSGVVAVAAGQSHALALLASGRVMSWGQGDAGQIGNGGTATYAVPILLASSTLDNVVAIAAGDEHNLALLGDGTVKAWGSNHNYQTGCYSDWNMVTADVRTPTAIPSRRLRGVVAISAGSEHSLALLGDGTVKAWGLGTNGERGDGSATSTIIPWCISSARLNNVVGICAGVGRSFAVQGNGIVKAWGHNHQGSLGLGNNLDQATPKAIPGLTLTGLLTAAPATCPIGGNLAWDVDWISGNSAGALYWFDASMAGSSPGFALPGVGVFPLNAPLLNFHGAGALVPWLINFVGVLDAFGHATPTLAVPHVPSLIGQSVSGAVLTLNPSSTMTAIAISNYATTTELVAPVATVSNVSPNAAPTSGGIVLNIVGASGFCVGLRV